MEVKDSSANIQMNGDVQIKRTDSKTQEELCKERNVLIGTYKGDQLEKWPGWYNYPIAEKDKISAEDAGRVNELWLFQKTMEPRHLKAEFVGIKTREELIRDYGYPAKGKAHGDKYLLFKTKFEYPEIEPLLGVFDLDLVEWYALGS